MEFMSWRRPAGRMRKISLSIGVKPQHSAPPMVVVRIEIIGPPTLTPCPGPLMFHRFADDELNPESTLQHRDHVVVMRLVRTKNSNSVGHTSLPDKAAGCIIEDSVRGAKLERPAGHQSAHRLGCPD